MTDYITSDTHFNHNNICGEDGFVPGRRIFPNAEVMNETIIKNFNEVVTNGDHTYHLGDIALNTPKNEVHQFLEQLNGSFSLFLGNHDHRRTFKELEKRNYKMPNGRMKYTFHDIGIRLKANKKLYYLTHFPLELGQHRPIYRNLCGHIHELATRDANQLNVGIDSPEVPERPFGQPLELTKAMELVDEKWSNWSEGKEVGVQARGEKLPKFNEHYNELLDLLWIRREGFDFYSSSVFKEIENAYLYEDDHSKEVNALEVHSFTLKPEKTVQLLEKLADDKILKAYLLKAMSAQLSEKDGLQNHATVYNEREEQMILTKWLEKNRK